MTRAISMPSAALVMGVMLLGAVPAAANRASQPKHADTFSGSCQISGSITFSPPLRNAAQDITQRARATGSCSGTFTGRDGRSHQLNNAPVSYQATEYAPNSSCEGGTDSGTGALTFPYGPIRFTISETRVVAVVAVTLNGHQSGSAAGQANVSPSKDPQQVLSACNSTGLSQAPFEARAATTPSISG